MTTTAGAAAAASTKKNHPAERTTTTTMLEDMIVPVARCLYTTSPTSSSSSGGGGGGLRKEYFSSFQVQHNSEFYRWKVHIGDMVAVATKAEGCYLTLEELEEWQPKHLLKASPHWKVGLVLALVQVVDPQKDGKVSHECHVEWLEKALDTPPESVEKLSRFYRKWSKQNEKTSRLPHVLLRSNRYQCVSPANLLPVQITMLSAKEFNKKGYLIWDPDDRFSFSMHCPKIISYSDSNGSATHQPDPAMDTWPELNHLSFAKKSSSNALPPQPLQQAWAKWKPVQEDDDLLQALLQGFRDSCSSKHQEYFAFKNRHVQERKKIDEEEQERLRILEEGRQSKLQKSRTGKRGIPSATASAAAAEQDLNHSSKRVRIHEPGETPKVSTTSKQLLSKTAKRKGTSTAVKSIIKKATLSVKAKFQQSHTAITPKSKTSSSKKMHVDTTPSTKSSSTASSPLDQLPDLRLSKRQQAMIIHAPVQTSIHRGQYRGQTWDFYERVNLTTDREAQPRVIIVGEVVAVVKEDTFTSSDFKPFDGPWGVAQILALYQVRETDEWIMQVRWLLRFGELSESLQERLLRRKTPFHVEQGLLETMEVAISPIQAILPVNVQVASDHPQGKLLRRLPDPVTLDYSTLPTLYFQCQYLHERASDQDQDDKLQLRNDWQDFSASSNKINGPLHRAFKCLNINPRVVQKYRNEVKVRSTSDNDEEEDSTSDEEDEESLSSLQVQALESTPIFEEWGVKFHDGVRMDIDRDTLVSSFTPQTTQWTIKVGYVIPVACEIDDDRAKPQRKDKNLCYPFICNWNPAQIISIYEDENGRWKMQIRWFHRYHELLEHQQSGLGELDKHHVVFETESYDHLDVTCSLPGRVVLSSSLCENWDVEKSKLSGLPLIPRFCSQICLDEEIDDSPDWTNYDLQLPSCPRPLMRGLLLDPRNRTKKEWILTLSRRYSKHISLRGQDLDDEILRKWEGQGPLLPLLKNSAITFDEKKVKAEIVNPWHIEAKTGGSRLSFSGSLKVSVPAEYIAVPSKAVRKARKLQCNVSVGDIVAYYAEDACQRSDHVLMKLLKYPWSPYRVSWCFGQILAIYSDDRDDSEQSPLLEIRRFYRLSEIPDDSRSVAPVNDDAEREEIFESDDLISSVSAARILGLSKVYLGKHDRASKASDERKSETLASCRCKYFYHSSHGRFQPIFSAGFSPETWWDRLFARGIALSRLVQSIDALKQATLTESKRHDSLDVRGLLGSAMLAQAGASGEVTSLTKSDRAFFTGAVLSPLWDEIVQSDVLYHPSDRANIMLDVKLGDFIAVRDDSCPTNESSTHFPFRCQWTPCQLLAIYSDGSNSVEELSFEVRYLRVVDEFTSGKLDIHEICQSSERLTGIVSFSDLLGLVKIIHRGSKSSFDWDTLSKKLPCALFYVNEAEAPELNEAMSLSRSYTEESLAHIMQALGSRSSSAAKETTLTRGAISDAGHEAAQAIGSPVFVDVSKLQAFYHEFRLHPQQNLFENASSFSASKSPPWTVKTGDVVLMHCDGPKRYPFKCNWGVAEIVAIWKQFEDRDGLEKDAHSSSRDDSSDLKVEIRWFYERHDVVGQSGAVSAMDRDEVFETDDVFILDDLTTILAPASLHSDQDYDQNEEKFMGSPIKNFLCRRFWSTHRKSLIPCGGLSGRGKRARMYSQVIPKAFPVASEASARTIADAERGRSVQKSSCSAIDWSESVKRIIAKLNLKEASTGAYNRGETLVGREKELSQLLSFFRAAIRGQPGPGGIRSSIFLAGAPGVGKTACIRSAISLLHSEQARGDLSTFNFIPLNGMEMRHPFEAYVKLWEAVTGRKHVGSHEKACQKLEYHFTNPKAIASDDDNSVTVVLLDEIDYLVTEKQSVLYNFFDWPKRAASVPGGRRLVVIGISNTLNLAEQLMPSVQSRVGSERIVFKAYSVKDAGAILKAKISEASPNYAIFENDAILFAAKKTAAMSGDIRKAFQICRGAAELLLRRIDADKENAPTGKYPTVRISDVQKASRESFDSALVTAVSFSTPFQALLLVSLASLCRTTGREVGGFDITDIMMKMEALSGSFGDPQYAPPPAFGETIQLLNRLAETNLINLRTASSSSTSFRSCGGGSGGAWPMTSLAVDEHTIVRGLKTTTHKSLAEKSLPSLF